MVIHQDIVGIWNFRDEDEILRRPSFKNAVLLLVQDLADANGPSPGSDTTKNLGSIKAALDVATPLSGPLAPVVASVGLSVMFAKWLSDMYNSTPGVLRCLMGYIVDITIVLEVLFWFKVAQPRLPSLCEDDIKAAFGLYEGSAEHLEVHRQIRRYVDNMTLLDQVNSEDKTHVEVERLIDSHRRVLIDTIFADAKRETKPTTPGDLNYLPPPETQSRLVASVPANQPRQEHTDSGSEGSRSTPGKKSKWFRLPKIFSKK